ncbi:MAG TPA: MMPL family transporter, partial [Thermomicrobiales bacterium]|nr:MMPL family transporter [Thermomicrobiales bacterium]
MTTSRFSTRGLARMSAHHPWRMLGAWLLIVVLAIALQGTMSGALTNDATFTNNPESKQGLDLIESRIAKEPLSETVVITSKTKTVDDAAFKAVVEQTTNDLTGMKQVVAGATNYYQAQQAGDPSAKKLVSKDGHSTIIPVTLTSSNYDDLKDYGKKYVSTAQGHAGNGIDVYAVGDLSGAEVYNKIADEDMGKDLTIGLPVAAIVLIFVFGALVAAGLPLLLGIVAIIVATGLTAVLSQIIDVNSTVTVMISMIGLAVGIDYALFLIERFREERRHGLAKHEAIEVAGGTAGKAVFFSGATVIFALLGMFIIPVSIFHSLAVGAVLAVLVAVFATQTLIPALLSLIGDKVNWPRRPKYDAASVAAQQRYDQETIHRGFWGRVTRVVMNRPAVAISAALLILVVAALPYFSIQTGMPGYETLPESSVKQGYEVLANKFYAGEIAPVEFVIKGAPDSPAVAQGVNTLKAKLADDPLYGAASVTGTQDNGGLTVVKVPMGVDPNSEQAFDQIKHLRNDVVPAAFGSDANHVYVTGQTAFTVDFNDALGIYTPYVFAFVLGLSFLLLMMAFRSIVVPAT